MLIVILIVSILWLCRFFLFLSQSVKSALENAFVCCIGYSGQISAGLLSMYMPWLKHASFLYKFIYNKGMIWKCLAIVVEQSHIVPLASVSGEL